MSIKTSLFNYLKSRTEVTGAISAHQGQPSIFPQIVPESAVLPYISIDRLSEPSVQHMGGASGIASVTFQINVWAATSEAAETASEAVRNVLDGKNRFSQSGEYIQASHLLMQIDDFQPAEDGSEAGTFRTIMDFRIWYARAAPTG